MSESEKLHDIEAELPLSPDSVVARYHRFDSTAFRIVYRKQLAYVTGMIDSLNEELPDTLRIDTLSIDHAMANFGGAACLKRTILISSSYFIIFDDDRVLRSVVFHEFGHLRYTGLSPADKGAIDTIWNYLQHRSLLYLFHDAEYSGNAAFGGHPNDSPSEMYASAFNLLNNNKQALQARLTYIGPEHVSVIDRLFDLTRPAAARASQ